MNSYKSNYDILLNKLDEFIRRYYKNQLVRGGIYSTATVLLFYISVTTFEYFAHLNTSIRTILFYSFIGINAFILGKLIIIPLLKLNKLGKIISNKEAAQIIGKHFTEVQDKLLNVLQLHQSQAESANYKSSELIEASINQKIKELKPVPFSSAIDLSQNKKHLKYALAPLLVLLFILFSAPSIITDGTKRLVNHATYFEKEAPFKFEIINNDLNAIQQEDYQLQVKITGSEIPNEVYVEVEGNEYRLDKENKIAFNYIFKNIQKSFKFRLAADDFKSKEYEINALPKPLLLDFQIALNYPRYIGKKDETINNTGDLVIPAGTKVNWKFNTQNTSILKMSFADTAFALNPLSENQYSYSQRFLTGKSYALTTQNQYLKNKDSVLYAISVIPDAYPSIQIEEQKDSLSSKRFYFRGDVKDDYGFSRLTFNYKFIEKKDSAGNTIPFNKTESKPLEINLHSTQNQFYHFWDMSNFGLTAGDKIEYYFEVWDNDGVNGSKSIRSQSMIFKAPTLSEIAEHTEKNNEKIKDDLEQSLSEAKKLQKQIADLNKNVLEKKQLGWEEKKKLQDMLDQQKELQKKVEDIQKENSKSNLEQNEFKQQDESLLEKQKQLEELFKNIMTDEMKALFKEMEKLLDKLDKDKVQQTLEKMKLNNKDVEKELDRTLELFKQMEFDQKLTHAIEKLSEMAKEQNKLAEKTQEKNADNKQLGEKQEELNKQFEEVKKDLSELEKKNGELEHPNKMEKTDPQQESVQQEMKNSSEQLQQNKNKKASQSQKNASEKMEQLANQLSKMQEEMEEEQSGEDMKALRDILENLVQLSFDQEAVMKSIANTKTNNPQYVKLTQEQKKLQDDSKMIEDSILALSKRNPQIESIVNREISGINMNMEKAIDALAERLTSEANSRQQMAMTSINNLALLLNEVLAQMQAQARNKGQPGDGSCKKPGGKNPNPNGKPSAASMRQMQQQLNQQIQKLKEELEKGGKKPGGKEGQGSEGMGMSEGLAKMAAQQEALRRQLQKMAEEMKKEGKSPGGNVGELAKMMEETETDLVNKMISQETIKRQQAILTKLLEHEKAEREKDMDEKRESKESKIENYSNLNQFLEYKKLKQKETELLKTVPPSLNKFYKSKVSEYFNSF